MRQPWWTPWRALTGALRYPKNQGKLKLTFTYSQAVAMAKRLSLAQAIQHCIATRIPAEFQAAISEAMKGAGTAAAQCPECKAGVQFHAGHAPGAHVADVECPHCHGAEIPFSTRIVPAAKEGRGA